MKQFTQVNNSKGLIRTLSGLKSRITRIKPALTMLMLLMFGVGQMWGDETVMFDGQENWSQVEKFSPDSFKIAKSHVVFSLRKDMKQYNKHAIEWFKDVFKSHEYFFLDGGASSELRWWVED